MENVVFPRIVIVYGNSKESEKPRYGTPRRNRSSNVGIPSSILQQAGSLRLWPIF